MFGKKIDIVIGLTTFNNDLLQISVPALQRLHRNFLLVVYNDNPTTSVTRRQIRRLGYRGPLRVVNGSENIDVLRARMTICDVVSRMRINPQWIIFINDDDILINTDIPNVGSDVFAIMQNALSLRRRVGDLLIAMRSANECAPDGENIVLVRPHTGICGVPVRMKTMCAMCEILNQHIADITKIDEELDFRPPYDAIMWAMLNTYVRHNNQTASPIYMDTTNYIMTNIDTATTKYGRTVIHGPGALSQVAAIVARYDAVMAGALRGMTDSENK